MQKAYLYSYKCVNITFLKLVFQLYFYGFVWICMITFHKSKKKPLIVLFYTIQFDPRRVNP